MDIKFLTSYLGCNVKIGNEYLIYTSTEYASHLTYHYKHYLDQHRDASYLYSAADRGCSFITAVEKSCIRELKPNAFALPASNHIETRVTRPRVQPHNFKQVR